MAGARGATYGSRVCARDTVPEVAASRGCCWERACLTTGGSARPIGVRFAANFPAGAEGRVPRGLRAQCGLVAASLAG